MRPILFHVGPIAVAAHGTLILLGVLAAAIVFRHEARRRGVWGDVGRQ